MSAEWASMATIDEHIQALHTALKSGEDTDAYAALVDLAIDARKALDKGRFVIGDVVRAIKTRYAESTLAQLADEIGIGVDSLYSYKSVADYYPLDARQRLEDHAESLHKDVPYTLYRLAMRLRNLEQSEAFIAEMVDAGYGMRTCEAILSERLGKPIVEKARVWSTRATLAAATDTTAMIEFDGEMPDYVRSGRFEIVIRPL